ncbi:MAG: DUF748 domain-containing protein [Catalinimonas sp.]
MHDEKPLKQKKRRRLGWWVAGAFVLLLLAAQGLLVYYATPLLRDYLRQTVAEQTDGRYELDFKTIRLSLRNRGLTLTDVRLRPDTSLPADGPRYVLTMPELELYKLHPMKLYRDRVVHIDRLRLTEPRVRVAGVMPTDTTATVDDAAQQNELIRTLYTMVPNTVRRVAVDNLEIVNGDLDVFRRQLGTEQLTVADKLTMRLQGFRLDSAALYRPDRLLFSDDVQFNFEHFRLVLGEAGAPGGLPRHVVLAKRVEISKEAGTVRVEEFRLTPDSSAAPDALPRVDVRVPAFEMRVKDLDRAYFEREAEVAHVHWRDPEVRYQASPTAGAVEMDEAAFELYPLISDYLRFFSIDTLSISGARFDLLRGDTLPKLTVGRLGLTLRDFRIDSLAGRDPDRLYYADDAALVLGDVTWRPAGETHLVEVDSVVASTFSSVLRAEGVRVLPRRTRRRTDETVGEMRIDVPALRISDLDLTRLYHTGDLRMGRLRVDSADVRLSRWGPPLPDDTTAPNADAYALLSDDFSSVSIDTLSLGGGQLHLTRHWGRKRDELTVGSLSLDLFKFRLDSATLYRRDRIFYADHLDFHLRDYALRLSDELHQFRADRVDISTRRSSVLAEGLYLTPNPDLTAEQARRQRSIYHLRVPKVQLHEVDIRRAYFQQVAYVGEIDITAPDVTLTRLQRPPSRPQRRRARRPDQNELYALVSDYLRAVRVNRVWLRDGAFALHQRRGGRDELLFKNRVSVQMSHFSLDSTSYRDDRLLFADDIDVLLREWALYLPDSTHQLTAGTVALSTARSEIVATDVALRPVRADNDLPGLYTATVPKVRLTGVDLEALYRRKELDCYRLLLDRPHVAVRLQPQPSATAKAPPPRMPNALREVAIQEVRVKRGGWSVLRRADSLGRGTVDLNVRRLRIDDAVLRRGWTDGALYESLSLHLENTAWRLDQERHELRLGDARFATDTKQLRLRSLWVVPTAEAKRAPDAAVLITAEVPRATLEGVRPEQLFDDGLLHLWSVRLDRPTLRLDDHRPDAPADAAPFDLRKLLDEKLRRVRVDRLSLADATVERHRHARTGEPLLLKDLTAEVVGFALDSASVPTEERPLLADDVRGTLRGYTTKQPLQTISTGEIGFSTAEHRVWIDEFGLTPVHRKQHFARALGYQKDYLQVSFKRAMFTGFRFDRLLNDGAVEAGDVTVDGLYILDYRDRQLPHKRSPKPMPVDQLNRIPIKFTLDRVRLNKATVTYEELPPEGQVSGYIDFGNLDVTARNVTNDPTRIAKKAEMEVNAEGLVMNQGRMKAHLVCYLDDPAHRFRLRGSMATFDLSEVNPILEPAAYMRVDEGTVDEVDFSLMGNEAFARGRMVFRYRDLKISLANKKTGDTKKLGTEIASFFANTFVLRANNPRVPFSPAREGEIYYERDPYKSYFSYYWRAVLSGLKTSVGMNPVRDKDRKFQADVRP